MIRIQKESKSAKPRTGLSPKRLQRRADAVFDRENFDPLEKSIKIAKGEYLREDHPFLGALRDTFRVWREKISKGQPIVESDIKALDKLAESILCNDYVPPKLRSEHIKELIQYLYPKMKASEVHIEGEIDHDHSHEVRRPLSQNEMSQFNEFFNSRF